MDVRTWLDDRTIYLARHGSHAYGTNVPTSDLDLRGVAIPPRQYLLGYLHRFEQAEQKGDPDIVIFDLRKFMTLAAECNPNVLEVGLDPILIRDSEQSIGWVQIRSGGDLIRRAA